MAPVFRSLRRHEDEVHLAERRNALNSHLNKIMADVASDVFVLCNVVAAGPEQWQIVFLNAMREAGFGRWVDQSIADRLFMFFCVQVLKRANKIPQGADDVVEAKRIAAKLLDAVEIHEPHVPSEREIAESFELESASSDEGQRFMYGGKTRDEVMRQFKGEIDSTLRENPLDGVVH